MYTSVTSYECCSERTEYDECILKLYLSQSRRWIDLQKVGCLPALSIGGTPHQPEYLF